MNHDIRHRHQERTIARRTLDEALRAGAIVSGMDIDEGEVLEGESIAGSVRKLLMASGDEKLVKITRQLPEESWARLTRLMTDKE